MKHKDVFNFIRKHKLYGVICDMLIELMNLDHEQTVNLLLEKNNINPDVVVEKLKNHELHLYRVSSAYWINLLFLIFFSQF